MNYEIVRNESTLFDVVETKTEQVMETFTFMQDAITYMSKLNSGKGFDGWTPKFFLEKAKNSNFGV